MRAAMDFFRAGGSARRAVVACAMASIGLLGAANCARGAEPLVTLSITQMAFPDQPQGTSSASQQVIVSNSGNGDLTIQSITITGQSATDFGQTSNCPATPAVLAAGASCQISVVCKPHTTGALAATLTIADTASGSPRSVTIAGNATAAAPRVTFSPGSLDFGNQVEATTSAAKSVVIRNAGSAVLNINSSISIGGTASSEFKIVQAPGGCPESSGQLQPRTSCVVAVVFAPTTIGGKSAQITVADDAPGSPHVIALSGTATAANATP